GIPFESFRAKSGATFRELAAVKSAGGLAGSAKHATISAILAKKEFSISIVLLSRTSRTRRSTRGSRSTLSDDSSAHHNHDGNAERGDDRHQYEGVPMRGRPHQ